LGVSGKNAVALAPLFALCLAVTVASWQQTPRARPEAAGLSAARLHGATELLNRYVAEQRIAGAVAAVARRGQVGYLEAVGVQDLQTRVPMWRFDGLGSRERQRVAESSPNDPSSRGEYGWAGTAGTIFWVDPVKETATC
jgi:CubicO group peptidase (beta-lactamase class C family)